VKRSLVLVTVDCLRADHTGFMGYPRPTSPFLDELARETLVFPRAIVTGAPTYYSFPGLLASRYPLSLGREVVGSAPGEATLTTALLAAGYRTAAFLAANPYLSARFGYEQGFETFLDFGSATGDGRGGRGAINKNHRGFTTKLNQRISKLAHALAPLGKLYAEAYFQYCQRISGAARENWESLRRFPSADFIVDQACDWLRTAGGQPFFLWLHFMDPHAPYYPTPQALAAMGNNISPIRAHYLNESWKRGDIGAHRLRGYRDEIVNLYDAGIRWVDMQLARLADFLRASSLWDSCVFVATADHGEEFLDHGGVFHSPARQYQEMLHVPLLIRVPGVEKKLSAAPFSLLHLAPTILDAMGIDAPPEFAGRSYWPEVQAGGGWDRAISESVGNCTNPMDPRKRMAGRVLVVQDERYKFILDFDSGAEELYDLESDAQEQNKLPGNAARKVRARMLRAAHEHLDRQRKRRNAGTALRALAREIGLEWSHSGKPAETLAN